MNIHWLTCLRFLNVLHLLTHLIYPTILWGKSYYYYSYISLGFQPIYYSASSHKQVCSGEEGSPPRNKMRGKILWFEWLMHDKRWLQIWKWKRIENNGIYLSTLKILNLDNTQVKKIFFYSFSIYQALN